MTGFQTAPPPQIQELCADDDSGASSEDTSDEAFARRHAPQEEEERKRYMGWTGVDAHRAAHASSEYPHVCMEFMSLQALLCTCHA